MVTLLKSAVVFFLLGILPMPCATRLAHHNGQYFLDPLRKAVEWRNKADSISRAALYSKVQGVWNASWPTIIKQNHKSFVKNAFPVSEDRPYDVSKSCSDGLDRMSDGITEMEGWAWKMVDSSGKLPSGLLLGNLHWLGMYDECLAVSSDQSLTQQRDNSTVHGKHCLVIVGGNVPDINITMGIEFSICVPRTCNSTDAMALINQVVIGLTDEIYALDADCRDGSAIPLDSGAIAVITILCVLGVLLILGTCLDAARNHWRQQTALNGYHEDTTTEDDDTLPLTNGVGPANQKKAVFRGLEEDDCLYRFLMAFSVLENSKKILSLEPQQANRAFDALNGIRFLSMTWIMLGHTYMFAIPVASNVVDYIGWIQAFIFQPLINGTVAVDTFFVLSGTLSAYSLLMDIRAKGGLSNINWPCLYFHRFWRLTPLYMLLLAIWATLFKHFGSGPFWPQENSDDCENNWWKNLLYINNIFEVDSACFGWSWYLANDMQFFWLMPFFVAILFKWTLLGVIVVFVVMCISSTTTGLLTYIHDYPPGTPALFYNIESFPTWFQDVYFVPWCRINTYLIGVLLGFILYKSKGQLRIHKALVVVGWCLAFVCIGSVLYGLHGSANGHFLSPSINALYAGVHRTAWGVAVAWVVLACATGYGGFVNDLLSLPIMQPLSRLTFASYLIHQMVLYWYYFNLQTPLVVKHITAINLFCGHLILSYIISFIFSIVIEHPMINLERSFLRNRKNQD